VRNVSGQMVAFTLSSELLTTIALLPFSTFSSKNDAGNDEGRKRLVMGSGGSGGGGGDRDSDISIDDLPLEGNAKATISTIKTKKHLKKITDSLDMDISSCSTRVLLGFGFTFLFLLVFLLLPPPSVWVLNLFSTFIGIADATSQSGLYQLASNYKRPSYSSAAVLGAAMSGFVVSLLRLMTRSFFDTGNNDGLRQGAYLLMGFSFAFSFILIVAICIIRRNILQCGGYVTPGENFAVGVVRGGPTLDRQYETELVTMRNDRGGDASSTIGEVAEEINKDSAVFEDENESDKNIGCMNQLREIYIETLKITWKPTFSAFLNFFITLSLFPAVIVSIPSSEGRISFGDWLPVVLITVFNAADCLGRFLLWFETSLPFKKLMTKWNDNNDDEINQVGIHNLKNFNSIVWWPTFARAVFFPLLAVCIIPANNPLLHNDILSCVIVFIFGLSSGFIHCANFTVAPTLVDNEESRNATSLLLLIAIFLGLTLGAYFGLAVEEVIWMIAE